MRNKQKSWNESIKVTVELIISSQDQGDKLPGKNKKNAIIIKSILYEKNEHYQNFLEF